MRHYCNPRRGRVRLFSDTEKQQIIDLATPEEVTSYGMVAVPALVTALQTPRIKSSHLPYGEIRRRAEVRCCSEGI